MAADWVFEPHGDVDLAHVEALREAWYAVVDEWEPEQVVVDLRDASLSDSSWLTLLAGLAGRQRAHDGYVTVRNPPPLVVRQLAGTGLADTFDVQAAELS